MKKSISVTDIIDVDRMDSDTQTPKGTPSMFQTLKTIKINIKKKTPPAENDSIKATSTQSNPTPVVSTNDSTPKVVNKCIDFVVSGPRYSYGSPWIAKTPEDMRTNSRINLSSSSSSSKLGSRTTINHTKGNPVRYDLDKSKAMHPNQGQTFMDNFLKKNDGGFQKGAAFDNDKIDEFAFKSIGELNDLLRTELKNHHTLGDDSFISGEFEAQPHQIDALMKMAELYFFSERKSILLADDMGLGKTMTILMLVNVVKDFYRENPKLNELIQKVYGSDENSPSNANLALSDRLSSNPLINSFKNARASLLITPSTVLTVWITQIKKFCVCDDSKGGIKRYFKPKPNGNQVSTQNQGSNENEGSKKDILISSSSPPLLRRSRQKEEESTQKKVDFDSTHLSPVEIDLDFDFMEDDFMEDDFMEDDFMEDDFMEDDLSNDGDIDTKKEKEEGGKGYCKQEREKVNNTVVEDCVIELDLDWFDLPEEQSNNQSSPPRCLEKNNQDQNDDDEDTQEESQESPKNRKTFKVLVIEKGNTPLTKKELEEVDLVIITYGLVSQTAFKSKLIKKNKHQRRSNEEEEEKRSKKSFETIEDLANAGRSLDKNGYTIRPILDEVSDYEPEKGVGLIYKIHWNMLLLEEAHHNRNKSTDRWNAVHNIHARGYGCITGTPSQNNILDTISLLKLMRVRGIENFKDKDLRKQLMEFGEDSIVSQYMNQWLDFHMIRRSKQAVSRDNASMRVSDKCHWVVWNGFDSIEEEELYKACKEGLERMVLEVEKYESNRKKGIKTTPTLPQPFLSQDKKRKKDFSPLLLEKNGYKRVSSSSSLSNDSINTGSNKRTKIEPRDGHEKKEENGDEKFRFKNYILSRKPSSPPLLLSEDPRTKVRSNEKHGLRVSSSIRSKQNGKHQRFNAYPLPLIHANNDCLSRGNRTRDSDGSSDSNNDSDSSSDNANKSEWDRTRKGGKLEEQRNDYQDEIEEEEEEEEGEISKQSGGFLQEYRNEIDFKLKDSEESQEKEEEEEEEEGTQQHKRSQHLGLKVLNELLKEDLLWNESSRSRAKTKKKTTKKKKKNTKGDKEEEEEEKVGGGDDEDEDFQSYVRNQTRSAQSSTKASSKAKKIKSEEKENMEKLQLIIKNHLIRMRQLCSMPCMVKPEYLTDPKFGTHCTRANRLVDWINSRLFEKEEYDPRLLLDETDKLRIEYERLKEKKVFKVVVFFQFVKPLEIISKRLEMEGIKHCVLIGKMNTAQRNQSILTFREDESIQIMLASITAASEGWDGSIANRVVEYDPGYNPMMLLEAIDRVHRTGIDNNFLFHYTTFITKDTCEENIIHLRDMKLEEVNILDNRKFKNIKNTELNSLTDRKNVRSVFLDKFEKKTQKYQKNKTLILETSNGLSRSRSEDDSKKCDSNKPLVPVYKQECLKILEKELENEIDLRILESKRSKSTENPSFEKPLFETSSFENPSKQKRTNASQIFGRSKAFYTSTESSTSFSWDETKNPDFYLDDTKKETPKEAKEREKERWRYLRGLESLDSDVCEYAYKHFSKFYNDDDEEEKEDKEKEENKPYFVDQELEFLGKERRKHRLETNVAFFKTQKEKQTILFMNHLQKNIESDNSWTCVSIPSFEKPSSDKSTHGCYYYYGTELSGCLEKTLKAKGGRLTMLTTTCLGFLEPLVPNGLSVATKIVKPFRVLDLRGIDTQVWMKLIKDSNPPEFLEKIRRRVLPFFDTFLPKSESNENKEGVNSSMRRIHVEEQVEERENYDVYFLLYFFYELRKYASKAPKALRFEGVYLSHSFYDFMLVWNAGDHLEFVGNMKYASSFRKWTMKDLKDWFPMNQMYKQ